MIEPHQGDCETAINNTNKCTKNITDNTPPPPPSLIYATANRKMYCVKRTENFVRITNEEKDRKKHTQYSKEISQMSEALYNNEKLNQKLINFN